MSSILLTQKFKNQPMRYPCLCLLLVLTLSFQIEAQLPENYCQAVGLKNAENTFASDLKKFEQELIRNNVLKNTNDDGYTTLLKQIVKDGGVDYIREFNNDELNSLGPAKFGACLQKVLSSLEYPPELGYSKFLTEVEDYYRRGNVDISIVAKLTLDYFGPDEIASSYVKLRLLAGLYINAFTSLDQWKILSSGFENNLKDRISKDSLFIEVKPGPEIYVDGKQSTIRKMKKRVYAFIKKHPKDGKVIFTTYAEVSYADYLSINGQLQASYKRMRNRLSEKMFKKPYSDLESIQQIKSIREEYVEWVIFKTKKR